MKGSEAEYRRVTIGIPAKQLPELLEALGYFAMDSNVRIEVTHPPEGFVMYNPDIVTEISLSNIDGPVAAVTPRSLQAIEEAAQVRRGTAMRTWNLLRRSSKQIAILDEAALREPGADYRNVLGLRADTFERLVTYLTNEGNDQTIGFSEHSVRLLAYARDRLYRNEA